MKPTISVTVTASTRKTRNLQHVAVPTHGLSTGQVLQVAGLAELDPRTVRKYLAGKYVRDMANERIKRAIAQLGFQTGGSDSAVPAPATAGAGGGRKGTRR